MERRSTRRERGLGSAASSAAARVPAAARGPAPPSGDPSPASCNDARLQLGQDFSEGMDCRPKTRQLYRFPVSRTRNNNDDREQRIRLKAFYIWLDEGCPDGRAQVHWDMAAELVAIEDRDALNPIGAGR